MTAPALAALILGQAAGVEGQAWVYRETAWSYRRPLSYEIVNDRGEMIGHCGPIDRSTRDTAQLSGAGQPLLLLTVDRAGDTVVADPAGGELGRYQRWFALTAVRMRLRADGRDVGVLQQDALRPGSARVLGPQGEPAAWIARTGGRFAGAAFSRIQLAAVARHVPGALLAAAVPALDAYRKAARSNRM